MVILPNLNSLQPPQELLLVGAAVKTGLFESLRGRACSVDELSADTGCHPRAVWVVTEALVSLGYLFVDDGRLRLTPDVEDAFFNEDSDNYTGFSFMHGYEICRSWLELPNVMKTGRAEPRQKDPDALKFFIKAMGHYPRQTASRMAALCLEDMPSGARVLDIGGGPLTYARAFAREGALVTVLDLPAVVDMMKQELEPGGPITMVPGDFNVELPEGPFDLAYLGNICHIYGEEDNRKLFARVKEVLNPGGVIAIQDFIRGVSPRAALFGVNMLVNTKTGGTWTLEEYTNWLQAEGFSGVQLINVGERQVIKAVKPL